MESVLREGGEAARGLSSRGCRKHVCKSSTCKARPGEPGCRSAHMTWQRHRRGLGVVEAGRKGVGGAGVLMELRTYALGQFEALCRTSCGRTRTGVSESSVGEAASGDGRVLSGLMVVVCGLDGLESISGSELDSTKWAANAVGRRLQAQTGLAHFSLMRRPTTQLLQPPCYILPILRASNVYQ